MKKIVILLAAAMLLGGCSAPADFETMKDVYGEQQLPLKKEVSFTLPKDASTQVMQSTYGQLYFCDGYEITMQTFSSGNLDATLRELTGFGREMLSVIETNGRYECVWTAAGEDGNVVGRAVILDDGNYHYCMTVMADEEDALQLRSAWKALFDSFILG